MAVGMISIPLLLTEKHACSYLTNETAQPAFVHPVFSMTTAVYSKLIQQGFRRSGDEVYSPYCPSCNACVPARIKVSEFIPNRTQKRCLQKNLTTKVEVTLPEFKMEHFNLYLRYQACRHPGGAMQESGKDEYLRFLNSVWCDTRFVEFLIDGELAAVAVIDRLDNALSAVYTFFDPKFKHYSLGVNAVLWQIEWAKQLGKDYVYLGFWIKSCKKMSYKSNFQPLQILKNKVWVPYQES
jgi:arginine-tRNA-protein transferase